MKLWLKIALVIIVVGLAGGGWYVFAHSSAGIDRDNPPKFIQADFIDLTKIYSVSKFRSGEGHDFSGGGETCRSMKHYFMPQFSAESETYRQQHNGLSEGPRGDASDIAIYSPVDGTITNVQEEQTPIGKQVYIVPDTAPDFTLRLFHIYLSDGIAAGTKVSAGQKIGTIGRNQTTDIAVMVGQLPWNQSYVSYFSVLPDSLFAEYQKRGASTPADFIISKQARDAAPLQCNGEQFAHAQSGNYDNSADIFPLSGYIDPRTTYRQ